ncbi:BadF-type ATPase [Sinosporangium album]|uniref:BadF-type ATPase n=1 Tax=Sinosporangium album TaxID=504805 RepID=A0A1G7RU50_9ACTN|nr:BadF/BadG/BcrA/BcrD ATPase family protein [Sinosporangium album]SDG14174.1 BadF-type ATPase [Sinosporangium album]
MSLVLGVDAGGTSTRAVVATAAGVPLGSGRAEGGNPAAQGIPLACANIAQAVSAALRGEDPARVTAVTVGLAGSGVLQHPQAREAFDAAFRSVGVTAAPHVLGDVVVAFAAGTAEPAGTVVLSGTGAICARIADREEMAIADGFGWQLGDEGSGFWVGRAAAKAVVRHLARGASASTPLTGLVVEHLLGDQPPVVATGRDLADLVCGAVQAGPPVALAALAPLVARASLAGDPMAVVIVEEAAARLVASACEVRDLSDDSPIVLAGSVLTTPGPFQDAVRARLDEMWRSPVSAALDGASAAAWLAACEAFALAEAEARSLHAALVRPRTLPPIG